MGIIGSLQLGNGFMLSGLMMAVIIRFIKMAAWLLLKQLQTHLTHLIIMDIILVKLIIISKAK